MRLFDLPWGPFPRRVTIYIAEKGLDIELIPVSFATGEHRSEEILRRNPMGSLPILELDDGTCLVDSYPIMEYLEEIYPKPCLTGRTPIERARMHSLMDRTFDLFNRAPAYYYQVQPEWARLIKQDPKIAEYLKPKFDLALKNLEFIVDAGGPFLMGERLTIADCTLYPIYDHYITNYDFEIFNDEYPKLQRWARLFQQRPSAEGRLRDDGLGKYPPFEPPPGKKFWWQQ